MAKHSKEKIINKSNNRALIIFAIFIIVLLVGIIAVSIIKNEMTSRFNSIKDSTTIEGKRLVFRNTSEYNRIIEYTFENNILKTVKIYEQFEEKEEFEQKKNNYEMIDSIEIINTNEEELSIEIEKKDFGSDTGKTYEEMYDKYLIQIIGAYEVIY